MDFGLKDKVALVTGAGSQTGFGKGIAMTLAREGCHIVIIDQNLEGAKQTAAEIEATGRKAIAYKADISKSDEVNDAVHAALRELGRIDILVNDAGMATPPKPFVDKTEEEFGKYFFLFPSYITLTIKFSPNPGLLAAFLRSFELVI